MRLDNRIEYLEGLRGLAALVVVICHFVGAFYPALISGNAQEIHTQRGWELFIAKSPLNIFYNGNFAVCIFFVLSGFVLTRHYFSNYSNQNNGIITSSAVRRYPRLLIPIFFSVLLVYVCMKLSLFGNVETSEFTYSTWWLGTFWKFDSTFIDVIKFSFYDVFISSNSKYNTVLWTMYYEFIGSFLVFAAALIIGKMKNRSIIYCILILLFIKTYFLAFIFGLILSDIFSSVDLNKKLVGKKTQVLLLMVGIFLGSYPTLINVNGTLYSFLALNFVLSSMFYHIIGAFFVLIVLLNSKRLQKILSLKPFLFLGKISFSMYLMHTIIIGTFSCFVFIKIMHLFTYSVSVSISFISSMIVIFIVSYFYNIYVDQNGVRFSMYLYNRIFKKKINNK
ncbi:acyltransferase [Paenibacillus sp. WQ 127069]|uniref:Acyltransferase n=1 Tax=Paenibacillus baimaensis TaxID=2982185 RepID=A0ABT2UU99_9BACL|nr:acyltransferase [Paenibacillus sp. WQ 127069]MCU6797397.1 acyltransferase [Paenibacillus sp. WQ 127069]